MIKFVCIDQSNKIVYIYAEGWDEAVRQAEEKGYKLQGKFVEEHD